MVEIQKKKQLKANYSGRSAIGALFKAVTLSTDPAHTLGFCASLISASRASLVYKFEQSVSSETAIPALFNAILKAIAIKWTGAGMMEEESLNSLNDRINKMFPSEAMMRYDLETYRDIMFCDDLHRRWKSANEIYIQSPKAWAVSNGIIADINMQLMEVITRHDLMEFPKGESFNLDDHGTDISAIAGALARQNGGGGEG